MEVPKLQWFVVAILFMVYWSVLSAEGSSAKEFKFLIAPKMFYAVPFGSNFKINCTTNDPNATTSLYHRDGGSKPWQQLLPKAGELVNVGHVYTVIDFRVSDAGQYQCRARNEKNDTIKWPSFSGNVIPNPNLTPDVEIFPKHAVDLTTGQSYNITCSSVAHTTLQWFKKLDDGSESVVPSNKLYKESNSGMNKLKLILMFKDAKKSDAGIYRCLMTYQGKTNFKYATLEVYAHPRIKSRKKILSVNETSRVVMRCAATGNPLPNITWYKDSNLIGCSSDGKPCGPKLQYTLKNRVKTKNGTKFVRSQLRVHRTSRVRDQGKYTCVASNKYGVARRPYHLTIN